MRGKLVLAVFSVYVFQRTRHSRFGSAHSYAHGQKDSRTASGFCFGISVLFYRMQRRSAESGRFHTHSPSFSGGQRAHADIRRPCFLDEKDGKYTGCEKTAFAFPLRGETENEGALSSFYLWQDTCYYKETSSGDEVDEGIADWYNSVICLRSENKDALTERAAAIIDVFENYSNENADIIARSGDKQHNAVSVTALNSGWKFTLYLILRNNRTDELYPEGIFHAHPRYHALKKRR